MTNLYTRLSGQFPEDRERRFATLGDGAVVTYADVDARSARFAHALTGLGVEVGDRIAVQAEKSIDMLMLYLGCLRAGAVFLPLNPAYTAGELDYFIRDAEPALVVCTPETLAVVRDLAAAAGVSSVETLDTTGGGTLTVLANGAAERFETLDVADDALAAILYTSGTTG